MAVVKACRGLVCGAVVACLRWGESIDRAEDLFCMRGGLLFEEAGSVGVGKGVCEPCRKNIRTHMYANMLKMDCACRRRRDVGVM